MNFEHLKVRSNTPYPKITGATDNPKIVAILKDLNSGRFGEITAVLQYTYQDIVCGSNSAEIAKIFEEIAIVEMLHSELLGDAIKDFGGNPVYQDGKGQWFSSGYVNYSTKLIEMLDANITAEKKAILDYTNAITMVDNQSLKALLQCIIEDEKLHLQAFKEIKENVKFFSI